VAADSEARTEQVLNLTGWLKSHDSAPFQVLAGDFNEVPAGPAITLMKQSYRSALYEFRGQEPLATFPTALVRRQDDWSGCLDYIFISSAVPEVLQAQVFCKKADPEDHTLYPSDHVGLLATMALDRQAQ
jgi:endonuclease/exonuclease/phosphatase family metal-dependent hydrolase